MTDNFELIKQYICDRECEIIHDPTDTTWSPEKQFNENEDKYYVIELMRRGKDNPDLLAANVHFKNYYINKISDLDKYKDEIKFLCESLRMRAYFSVNYKLYSQCMMDTVAEMARRVACHDYKRPYAIYESCSGKYCANGNKTWIIDVDKEDADDYGMTLDELTNFYKFTIRQDCKPQLPAICVIPTKTGKHIICHPFDVAKFNEMLRNYGMKPHSDSAHQIIKKNHLTLLYENL